MISSQMLKGTLEGCILVIISQKETYGYEISQQLENYGFGKIVEGTIYPLLLRLEKNDLITATYKQSDVGPRRKYYSLTRKGYEEILNFQKSYDELSLAVNRLLKDIKGGDHYES
ncbi:PadR family transcriptional regulator [Candidatus Stoquefichus massiliensis]|uniref:PadR family transcriptional regulator n=1 Tax=Candidatus Stoquefichus massiliensis TaxID=1470350 RepID=UPI0004876F4E|nr:PadR family transcriptional regulator [Candidatus Stoquefichus massiliensis]